MLRIPFAIFACLLAFAACAADAPHGLTVEYRTDPVGMDAECPRFSWKVPDGGRKGVLQTAYRIRVEPDAWDSGEVRSRQSLNVEYAGKPLEPSKEYFWTVETLDNHGRRSVSKPARFRTGLLRPENWSAKWITVNPQTLEDYDLMGAEWIGTKDGCTLSFAAEAGDIDPRAAEVVHVRDTWRPSFDVRKSRAGILACTAERAFSVVVNGRTAMKLGGGPILRYVDVAGHLLEGTNAVSVRVDGGGAFIARLALPGGRTFATGRSWPGAKAKAPFGGRLVRTVEKCSPAFRKAFRTAKPVRDAVLHISGLGFYEATLDGRRIGKKVLDPAPTDYSRRVLYSTYEVAGLLAAPGEHSLDVLVGRGAYDEHLESWNFDAAPWRGKPCLVAQLELTYADGSRERIATDGSWRQVGSPVLWDDLREGEIHAPGDVPQIDLPATVTNGPKGRLEAMPLPGAEKVETWRPKSIERLANGHWAVDFGQNLSGWARIRLRSVAKGDVVTVQYAEKRNADGTVSLDGNDHHFHYPHSVLRMPGGWLERDRHVASGAADEFYEPKFSYSGFRYLEIDGLAEPLRDEDVEAYQVNTAFASAGTFECSNGLFNRIHQMFVRAYLANFTDGVPTDCPQREKNGWTGDAQLAAEMGQYCFENTAGYEKWCRDLVDAQRPDGGIPSIVPTGGWGAGGAGPAWDCAIAVVPWTLYRYRDDRRILEETYPALRRYILWSEKRLDRRGLANYGLGDWCAPIPYERWSRDTPFACTSTACWYDAVRIASESARALGKDEDAHRFTELAERTKAAMQKAFQSPDGKWSSGTQTAQAVALGMGLVPPEMRGKAAERLHAAVEENARFSKCGIIGSKWLYRALSETGRGDLACAILCQTNYPSFGDWLAKGATTAWESWKGAASQNHVMFGDVSAWLFQYPGGIRLDGEPGFRNVLLAPETDGLSWARASHESPYGTIRSEWRIEGGRFEWTVEVPPNTTATALLPPGLRDVAAPADAEPVGLRGGRAAYRLGSGTWRFAQGATPQAISREEEIPAFRNGVDGYRVVGGSGKWEDGRFVVSVDNRSGFYMDYSRFPGMKPFRGAEEIVLATESDGLGKATAELVVKEFPSGKKLRFTTPLAGETHFKTGLDASKLYQLGSLGVYNVKSKDRQWRMAFALLRGVFRSTRAEALHVEAETGNPLHIVREGKGESPVLVVRNAAQERIAARGTLKVKGFCGDEFDLPVDVALDGGGKAEIPISKAVRKGVWRIGGKLTADDGSAVKVDTRFAVMDCHAKTPKQPRGTFRLGINWHMGRFTPEDLKLTTEAMVACGAKLARRVMANMSSIQRDGPDSWDFSSADRELEVAEANGISLDAIIFTNPRWAAKPEYRTNSNWMVWANGAPTPGVFGRFCERLAARYGTRIDYYEIGNEWDLGFRGTLDEAVEIQREAYASLKRGCPDVCVIPNGWAQEGDTPMVVKSRHAGFQERFMKAARDFADVHPIHIHGGFAAYVKSIRDGFFPLRRRAGVDGKPWYSNETALTSVWNERTAAMAVWKKVLWAWANGSVDYIWYNLKATGWDPKDAEQGYGMITADFFPRDSYVAFAALATVVGGAEFRRAILDDGSKYCFEFSKGDSIVLAAWDESGGVVEIPVETDAARAWKVDMMGNRAPQQLSGGKTVFKTSAEPRALVLERAAVAYVDKPAIRSLPATGVGAVLVPSERPGRKPDFVLDRPEQVHDFFEANPAEIKRLWTGLKDNSAKVWLAREKRGLRIRVEVEDDVHCQPYGGGLQWRGDDVQVALGVLGQGGQWEFGFAHRDDGRPDVHCWIAPEGFDTEKAAAWIELGTSREGTTTRYDALVPYAPETGYTEKTLDGGIRFNLSLNDNDGDGRDATMEIVPNTFQSKDIMSAPVVRFAP